MNDSEFHEEAVNILMERHKVCTNTYINKFMLLFYTFLLMLFYVLGNNIVSTDTRNVIFEKFNGILRPESRNI